MKPETINVDYHFHPNLSKNNKKAEKKVIEIYKKFKEVGVNAVIVTEHIYKDYRRAWELMKKHKPEDFFIFPGIEYVTSEDLDIVIFSENEEIYKNKLDAFKFDYKGAINFIKNHNKIYGFITHPLTLGWTSVINKKGISFEKEMVNELKSVEKEYMVYSKLKKWLSKPFVNKIFKKTLARIKENENLPAIYCPTDAQFFATGSDAHHTWEIGNYTEVTIQKNDIFYSIVNNEQLKVLRLPPITGLFQDIISLSTVLSEWLSKKYYTTTH